MAGDVIDFDAFYAEQAHPKVTIRLLGREWELPGDPPAAAMLRLERLRVMVLSDDVPAGLELGDVTYESLTRLMLGDDLVDQWLELGIKDKQLRMVTTRLYAIYKDRAGTSTERTEIDADEAGEGEGKAPGEGI